jgi:hypothetical protein
MFHNKSDIFQGRKWRPRYLSQKDVFNTEVDQRTMATFGVEVPLQGISRPSSPGLSKDGGSGQIDQQKKRKSKANQQLSTKSKAAT